MRATLTVILLLLVPLSGSAEIYRGIGPYDMLGDVKARFPHAQFERVTPTWAQAGEVLYLITEEGLGGTIVVIFSDGRRVFRDGLNAALKDGTPQVAINTWRRLADLPDDQGFTVSWVAWNPDKPVPLQRLVSLYGVPEDSGVEPDSFTPYRMWTKKRVKAFLSDDEKNVVRMFFAFTLEEKSAAWEGFVRRLNESSRDPSPSENRPDTEPTQEKTE